jgi:hypothetical protein
MGNKTFDYWQLRGMNMSDEAILAAANANGTKLNGSDFVLKGNKNFKAAQNNEAYQNLIAEHGGVGFGGDYSKYGDWYDKLGADVQARLGGKMKEKEFKKMMTGQHDLEREYASQYFGGNSNPGKGGSGSGKEEGGVWNWIKENPGKTAAIGGGALVTGLGARALLKGRDDRDDRYYR